MSQPLTKTEKYVGPLIFWGMIPLIIIMEYVYYENNGKMGLPYVISASIMGVVICGVTGYLLWRDKDKQ